MNGRRRIGGLKGSWEWLEFAAQLPANPQFFSGLTANSLIFSGRCILTGAFASNSGTATGSLQLLDGVDATGGLVTAISLAAAGVGTAPINAQGILCEIGVYALVATATLKGSVWVIPLWHDEYTAPGD